MKKIVSIAILFSAFFYFSCNAPSAEDTLEDVYEKNRGNLLVTIDAFEAGDANSFVVQGALDVKSLKGETLPDSIDKSFKVSVGRGKKAFVNDLAAYYWDLTVVAYKNTQVVGEGVNRIRILPSQVSQMPEVSVVIRRTDLKKAELKSVRYGDKAGQVEWYPVEGATDYEVTWGEKEDFPPNLTGGSSSTSLKSGGLTVVTVPMSTSRHTISSLENNRVYGLLIKPLYGQTAGYYSDFDEFSPSSKTEIPRLESDDHKLLVKWENLLGAKAYRVEWRQWGKSLWKRSEDISADETEPFVEYTIDSLNNGVAYEVKVVHIRATAGDVASDAAYGVPMARVKIDPSGLSIDDGSVTVSWEKSTNADWEGNTGADGYKIEYGENDGNNAPDNPKEVTIIGNSVTSFTLGGAGQRPLVNGREYIIQVRPYYILDYNITELTGLKNPVIGSHYNSLAIMPIASPIITGGSPSHENDGRVTLFWRSEGGDPDSYVVSYSNQDKNESGDRDVSGSLKTATIGNLTNGNVYEFTVKAGYSGSNRLIDYKGSVTELTTLLRTSNPSEKYWDMPVGIPTPSSDGGDSHIVVNWSMDSKNDAKYLINYEVEWKREDSNSVDSSGELSKNESSYRVTSLANGKEYELRVFTIYEVPQGNPLRALLEKSKPSDWDGKLVGGYESLFDIPRPPVTDISTKTSGGHTIELSWNAPAGYRGNITDYTISYLYRNKSSEKKKEYTVTASGNSSESHTLVGGNAQGDVLVTGNEYEFIITAIYQGPHMGDSVENSESSPHYTILVGQPTLSPVIVDRQTNSAYLQWRYENQKSDYIETQTVSYTTEDNYSSDIWSSTAGIEAGKRDRTLNNLTANSYYGFRVVAYYESSNVAKTKGIESETRWQVVDEPPVIESSTSHNRSIEVTWKAPPAGSLVLEGYQVHWEDSKTGAVGMAQVSASTLRYTIDKIGNPLNDLIVNGRIYEIKVNALYKRPSGLEGSGQLAGNPSDIRYEIAAGVPQVTTVTGSSLSALGSDGEIRIEWDAPDGDTDSLLEYELTIYKGSVNTNLGFSTANRYATISPLENGVEYDLRVRSVYRHSKLGATEVSQRRWSDYSVDNFGMATGIPKAVTVTSDNNKMIVAWDKPSGSDVAIEGYDIYVDSSSSVTVNGKNTKTYVLSAPSAVVFGREYDIKVRTRYTGSQNSSPLSGYSSSKKGVPLAVPSVTSVSGNKTTFGTDGLDGKVKVEWTIGGEKALLKNYQAAIYDRSGNQIGATALLSKNDNDYIFDSSSLSNGSEYQIKLKSVYQGTDGTLYEGSFSQSVWGMPAGPVGGVIASGNSKLNRANALDGKISVEWDRAPNVNKYDIEVWQGGVRRASKENVSGKQTTVSGVPNGVVSTVKVKARYYGSHVGNVNGEAGEELGMSLATPNINPGYGFYQLKPSWGAVTGATEYSLSWSGSASGTQILGGGATSRDIAITGPGSYHMEMYAVSEDNATVGRVIGSTSPRKSVTIPTLKKPDVVMHVNRDKDGYIWMEWKNGRQKNVTYRVTAAQNSMNMRLTSSASPGAMTKLEGLGDGSGSGRRARYDVKVEAVGDTVREERTVVTSPGRIEMSVIQATIEVYVFARNKLKVQAQGVYDSAVVDTLYTKVDLVSKSSFNPSRYSFISTNVSESVTEREERPFSYKVPLWYDINIGNFSQSDVGFGAVYDGSRNIVYMKTSTPDNLTVIRY